MSHRGIFNNTHLLSPSLYNQQSSPTQNILTTHKYILPTHKHTIFTHSVHSRTERRLQGSRTGWIPHTCIFHPVCPWYRPLRRTSPWYNLNCTGGGCRICTPPDSSRPLSVRAWLCRIAVFSLKPSFLSYKPTSLSETVPKTSACLSLSHHVSLQHHHVASNQRPPQSGQVFSIALK